MKSILGLSKLTRGAKSTNTQTKVHFAPLNKLKSEMSYERITVESSPSKSYSKNDIQKILDPKDYRGQLTEMLSDNSPYQKTFKLLVRPYVIESLEKTRQLENPLRASIENKLSMCLENPRIASYSFEGKLVSNQSEEAGAQKTLKLFSSKEEYEEFINIVNEKGKNYNCEDEAKEFLNHVSNDSNHRVRNLSEIGYSTELTVSNSVEKEITVTSVHESYMGLSLRNTFAKAGYILMRPDHAEATIEDFPEGYQDISDRIKQTNEDFIAINKQDMTYFKLDCYAPVSYGTPKLANKVFSAGKTVVDLSQLNKDFDLGETLYKSDRWHKSVISGARRIEPGGNLETTLDKQKLRELSDQFDPTKGNNNKGAEPYQHPVTEDLETFNERVLNHKLRWLSESDSIYPGIKNEVSPLVGVTRVNDSLYSPSKMLQSIKDIRLADRDQKRIDEASDDLLNHYKDSINILRPETAKGIVNLTLGKDQEEVLKERELIQGHFKVNSKLVIEIKSRVNDISEINDKIV